MSDMDNTSETDPGGLVERCTAGRFESAEAVERVERLSHLAGDVEAEKERLVRENEDLRKQLAGVQKFAEIGRREFDSLRRSAFGKVQALLMHKGADDSLETVERRLDDEDLEFAELRRIHDRIDGELRETYATRPEAKSTELTVESPKAPVDLNHFRINRGS